MLEIDVKMDRAVELLTKDLRNADTKYSSRDPLPRAAADVIVSYILSNLGLIEHCLDVAYIELSEEDRSELSRVHPSYINPTAIPDSWHDLARGELEQCKEYWKYKHPVSYDRLENLERPLRFARYRVNAEIEVRLLMHPIVEFLP